MKNFFISPWIYLFFIVGGFLILTSIVMIGAQLGGCLSSNPNQSFLAEWLNITYFEEKERYESCMNGPDTYTLTIGGETMSFKKNKEVECKQSIGPDVCGQPNFKPSILYGIIGILTFFIGFRIRKKYLLK